MVSAKLLAIVALTARVAQAATPPSWEFTIPVNNTLNLTFLNNNNVNPPGELLPREDTAAPPNITVNSTLFPANATGIIFAIDIDVNRNGTRGPLLHWLVPGVKNVNGTLNVPVPSENGTAGKVNGTSYAQPSPPVGDSPHRYIFILFTQPANFSFPANFTAFNTPQPASRVGFNLTQFVADARIGGAPIAANYIQVQNLTGSATASFPPISTASATGRAATSTPAPTGGAGGAASSSSSALGNTVGVAAGAFGAGLMGLVAALAL